MTKVFVYGTLKRGDCNHHWLGNSHYLGEFATAPSYLLYDNGYYPCMVRSDKGIAIKGEIYDVTPEILRKLDYLEGLSSGLYERVRIDIPSFAGIVEGYLYLLNTEHLVLLGDHWDART